MNSATQEINSGPALLYFTYIAVAIIASTKFTKYILKPKLTAYRLFIGWLSSTFLISAIVVPLYFIVYNSKNAGVWMIGGDMAITGESLKGVALSCALTFWITAYLISRKENPTIERVLRWIFLIYVTIIVITFTVFGADFFESMQSKKPVSTPIPAAAQVPKSIASPVVPAPAPPQDTAEVVDDRAAREHFARIYAAHPDADNIMNSSVFNAWASQSAERRRILEKGTTIEVIDLFNTYKAQR